MRDLKYAIRQLGAKPGFVLDAKAAIFVLIGALLYRSLPVSHAEKMLALSGDC